MFHLKIGFQFNITISLSSKLYIHSKEKRETTKNFCHLRQRLRSNSDFSLMFPCRKFPEEGKTGYRTVFASTLETEV